MAWFEDFPWEMVTALGTLGIATVGWWQISSLRKEARIWNTLSVCEKYDQDPIITTALRNLKVARDRGELNGDWSAYSLDMVIVLNYLEGVATGIEQRLYIDSVARDHLEPVIEFHLNEYFSGAGAKTVDRAPGDYKRLKGLKERWDRDRPWYRDGWLSFRRRFK